MEPVQHDPAESGAEPRNDLAGALLVPLLRSRWLVLAFASLGVLAALVLGIIRPNTFLSSGKLLVRPSSREEATPETVISGPGTSIGQVRDQVNNELQLLSVPQVFERVAREVTPARIFSSYDPSAKDDASAPITTRLFHRYQAMWFQRASGEQASKVGHELDTCPLCIHETVHVLMKDISLAVEPGSSVITILYSANSPELARQVVDAFLDSAEEHHRKTFSTNTTLEFVAERLQESEAQEQQATAEFTEYRISCGVSDYDAQRTALMSSYSDLERQTAVDASRLEELRSKAKEIALLVADLPATVQASVAQPPVANPPWALLRTRLFELQDSLDRVERRAGGTTAEREAEREGLLRSINAIQAELKDTAPLLEQEPILQFVPNPQHLRLTEDHDNAMQDIAMQEVVVAKGVERLKSITQRLRQVEECAPRYKTLESQAEKAKTSYDAFSSAYERAKVMNLLDQLQFSNLRRIQEATLPLEKEGPKRVKFVIIGLILGSAFGGALGFLRTQLDPCIRSPAEVEQLLGVRVLSAVPPSGLSRRLRKMIDRAGQ